MMQELKPPNTVVATPLISSFVTNTVLAYHEAGALGKFYTTYVYNEKSTFAKGLKLLFPQIDKEFQRRKFSDIPQELIELYPYAEMLRTFSSRKLNAWITDKIWQWGELAFDKWVSRHLHENISWVHTYEHAALYTLQKARTKGIKTVYDQPSQHHSFFTPVAEQQLKLYPELRTTSNNLLIDQNAVRRNKRRDKELEIANLVLCNSSFTRRTLINGGVSENKIKVVPFGFPEVSKGRKDKQRDHVVFLNAGNQNLRKALHILYKAWRLCNFPENQAELWLIGKMELPENLRRDLPGKVIIKSNIPHTELMQLYQDVDVFVLPTLADGFGMVIAEAMASGVPVLTTENSGGPDIIDEMKNGWIVEAGNVEALVNQMKWCVENKEQLQSFGKAAMAKARSWQWSHFRKEVFNTIATEFKT